MLVANINLEVKHENHRFKKVKLVEILKSSAYPFLPWKCRQERFFVGYFAGDFPTYFVFTGTPSTVHTWRRKRPRPQPEESAAMQNTINNNKKFFVFSVMHTIHNRNICYCHSHITTVYYISICYKNYITRKNVTKEKKLIILHTINNLTYYFPTQNITWIRRNTKDIMIFKSWISTFVP